MHAFAYAAPTSLQEALAILAEAPGKVRPMAGGTDLIDQMRLGRYQPQRLLDVKKIPELTSISWSDAGLLLGAAVPCYQIASDSRIANEYAALADSCHILGGIQIQSRASFGGNLCNSGPAADSTPSMIALEGKCVIASTAGQREVPVEEFCTAPGKNVLEPGELLVAMRFPSRSPHSGSHYRRMIPRNEMDIAVVGVGASLQLNAAQDQIEAARIAVAAVGPKPFFAAEASQALVGQPASEEVFQQAGEQIADAVTPITDMRGTEEYRRHATGVLVRRVLAAATQRARGEQLDYRPGH